jgi:hypothetical protein
MQVGSFPVPRSTEPDDPRPRDPALPQGPAFDVRHPLVVARIADCRAVLAEAPVEQACAYLRAEGLSKVESIVVLAAALRVDPTEAKRLIHFNPAWADRRANDEEFHESLEKALEELAEDEGSISPS